MNLDRAPPVAGEVNVVVETPLRGIGEAGGGGQGARGGIHGPVPQHRHALLIVAEEGSPITTTHSRSMAETPTLIILGRFSAPKVPAHA